MSDRLPTRVVLVLVALTLLVFTKDRPDSWADGSRLGTVQGLVEHGTLALDDTNYLWQGDKIHVEGRFYSHQPPMLALCAALPYAALHHVFGRAIDDPFTYRVITWCVVGLPVLLGLLALASLLRESGCGPRWSAGWLAIAYFATLLLPYSLVLNQHGAAAGLTLVALRAATRDRAMAAGALMALAATIDLTAAFPALALLLPVVRASGPAGVARYALAATPVLALHLGVNVALVGDVLPPGLHTEAFVYPLSPFLIMSLTGGGGDELPGTQLAYLRELTVGPSGLLSNHPALLACLVAGVALLATRARHRLPGGALAAVAFAAAGIFTYYATQSRNLGGSAVGVRWFAVFAPLLVLLPAAWQGAREAPARRGGGLAALVAALALVSFVPAAVGAAQPWSRFAWTYASTPGARLDPGAPAPSWREHLRAEWRRTRAFEQAFDRPSYEAFYLELIIRCGRVHARDYPALTADAQEAHRRAGLVTMREVLVQLEKDPTTLVLQGHVHFWLAKIYANLGEFERARHHLRRCLEIITAYGPALKLEMELPPEARGH